MKKINKEDLFRKAIMKTSSNRDKFSRERIIVALDQPDLKKNLGMYRTLRGECIFFKVGLQAFLADGAKLIKVIKADGHKIFLDLKFYDIPEQVASASTKVAEMGVDMFTVHLSGGPQMLERTKKALQAHKKQTGQPTPKMIGVSVLTSFDSQTSKQIYGTSPAKKIPEFAIMAADAKLDGMVLSPLELAIAKKALADRASGSRFIFVTPGIRPAAQVVKHDDQSRVLTPEAAIKAGSDQLVIGRPITGSKDPLRTYLEIVSALQDA